MTKVGEDNSPHESTKKTFHKDLRDHLYKLEHALDEYAKSKGAEKGRLKTVMDSHLPLIQSSAKEIPTKEMHKQCEKVVKNYHLYTDFNSDENLSALKHDIQTLRDLNQIR